MKDSTKDILLKSEYITPVFSIQTIDKMNYELMHCNYREQLNLVEEFLSYNKKVRINSVYTYQTLSQIIDLYNYCVKKNVSRYSVAAYSETEGNYNMMEAHNLGNLVQLEDDMQKYIKENYSMDKSITTFATEGSLLFSCYVNELEENLNLSLFDSQYYGCKGRYTKMEIYSDGSVYPCYKFEGILGSTSNIFEKPILDIWQNDINYTEIRKQVTKNQICHSCGFVEICRGGCFPKLKKSYQENYYLHRDSTCHYKKTVDKNGVKI